MSNDSHPDGYVVAVLGATGLVGQTMISVLEERKFPVRQLVPLASMSGGRSVRFNGADIPVQQVQPESFNGVDIAIFSAVESEMPMATASEMDREMAFDEFVEIPAAVVPPD